MINSFPYLIAEISANHCGKYAIAKKLVTLAKKNGANAVKLQTYTAKTMTINSKKKYFKIKEGLWKNYTLWELYEEAHTPWSWHEKLFLYGKEIGITVFSTPFDETAVDFLESLKCPIYKVASFEMTDLPLIKKIAQTKKPMIISTGMANLNEIEKTYRIAKKFGSGDITLLYCVSNYPSKKSDFNINNIKILKDKFKCRVGLSDHSNDRDIAIAAVSAGAEVFEKHIALKDQKKGLDIEFSLKGSELKTYKDTITDAYSLLGKNYFFRSKDEAKSKIFRRSIFSVAKIRKGEKFSKLNIRRIRPGNGLSPEYYETLIGKKSPFDFTVGEPLTMKLIRKLKIK